MFVVWNLEAFFFQLMRLLLTGYYKIVRLVITLFKKIKTNFKYNDYFVQKTIYDVLYLKTINQCLLLSDIQFFHKKCINYIRCLTVCGP